MANGPRTKLREKDVELMTEHIQDVVADILKNHDGNTFASGEEVVGTLHMAVTKVMDHIMEGDTHKIVNMCLNLAGMSLYAGASILSMSAKPEGEESEDGEVTESKIDLDASTYWGKS